MGDHGMGPFGNNATFATRLLEMRKVMKTSRKMQEIVTAIATKYGLELNRKGAYLRLSMPHYDPFVIEVLHENLVNVAHV